MTTLMNWLVVLAVVSLSAVAISALWILYQIQIRWMRAFGERSGISVASMEYKHEPKPEVSEPPKPKQRMTIPIPGAQMFRKTS